MQNPYDKYRSNTVFTATKEELTLMLYDGALKFCNQAIVALENKNFSRANDLILKVEDIVREFQVTLDMKYDISEQLNLIYDYLYSRLVAANLGKDVEVLKEVRDHLRSLRDTWKEAMKLARQSGRTAMPTPVLAGAVR
ncbi:MAG: flagellar export chaperone FliS [Clostridiales bacterium]|jgi:flagellar protein FliS|nr:flagellar export chaperone FliS [Clostridiales bacterium]